MEDKESSGKVLHLATIFWTQFSWSIETIAVKRDYIYYKITFDIPSCCGERSEKQRNNKCQAKRQQTGLCFLSPFYQRLSFFLLSAPSSSFTASVSFSQNRQRQQTRDCASSSSCSCLFSFSLLPPFALSCLSHNSRCQHWMQPELTALATSYSQTMHNGLAYYLYVNNCDILSQTLTCIYCSSYTRCSHLCPLMYGWAEQSS